MKRSSIMIFIFSIIAALGLICLVFPRDGVGIGGLHLNFPSISDILGGADDDSLDAGRLSHKKIELDRIALAERAEQERKYLEFIDSDPSSFALPDDDIRFFDRFFEQLENSETKPLRIIHYGDSQIEEDRITSKLRARLQEEFGGRGPGMLPVRKYYTANMGVIPNREMRRFMVFGDRSRRSSDNRYGPYAAFVRMDSMTNVIFSAPKSNDSRAAAFDKATLVVGNIHGSLRVAGADTVYKLSAGNPLELISFDLKDSTKRFSVNLSGYADLYGMLLDGRGGVSVDNVPMRGSSGEIFTNMNSEQLRSFYEKANVKMILLQYGGNGVPYIHTEKAVQTYKESLGRQIAHVRSLAPEAALVLIGPSDMSTSSAGKRMTYPILPSLVDSLRAVATENGAAYWSIYDAMGGSGSMVSWVKSNPALASSDYIHFTTRGAAKMGDMFTDALMVYYEYYKWRKENE